MDPCDHLLQIYGNENVFLDALEGFVGSALRCGEGAVVIATAPHIHELEKRLRGRWIDVDRARWLHQYVAVLARETLLKFMVNDWPDEELFSKVAGKLLADARGADGRKVRAFGEMVSVLWAQGNVAAALRLELLWSKVATVEKFPVFCAYPRAGFEAHEAAPMQSLCAAHSQLLPG